MIIYVHHLKSLTFNIPKDTRENYSTRNLILFYTNSIEIILEQNSY